MKNTESELNLNEERGKLKQKFASLTNDDLLFEEGRKEEFSGKYERSLFQTREDLDDIMSTL